VHRVVGLGTSVRRLGKEIVYGPRINKEPSLMMGGPWGPRAHSTSPGPFVFF